MRTTASWAAKVDWAGVAVDVLIPLIGILVPTIIAIALFKAERQNARNEAKMARRLDAGAEVIVALAPMASIQPTEPMSERLWEIRARMAVYRSWSGSEDLSGDWLALRHREGMRRWAMVMDEIEAAGGVNRLAPHEIERMLTPAHHWAATTTEIFSAWLAGDLPVSVLQNDGARIIEEFGVPAAPDWSDEGKH